MKLSNSKISHILFAGFGVMLLVYLVSSALNATMMRKMQANLETMEKQNNVQIAIAYDLYKSVAKISLSVRKIILLNSDAEIAEEIKAYKNELDRYQTIRQRLNASSQGADIDSSWKAVDAAFQKSAPLLSSLYASVQEHRDSEAIKTLDLVGVAIDGWQQSLDAGMLHQQQENASAFKSSSDAYQAALIQSLSVCVVSIVVALVLSFGIVRLLSSQLGGEPREATSVAVRIGAGDLTQAIPVQAADTSSLMAAMDGMQASLTQVVVSVRNGAESVAMASAEIAKGNQDLSTRTERQASALEETSASMEELDSIVKQNADGAREANRLAQQASTVASEGGSVVGQVVETMRGINTASRKIEDIIGVIDGIAFQTNILALNAAVEAARAGEQGRGFAVVASEVRSLAGRSAQAAKEIKGLIGSSVERVAVGSQLADKAGATMEQVLTAIQRVTGIMAEISASSAQQSQGVSQIGEAIREMDQVTQQNAALVEQMAAAASSLQSQASDLVGTVAQFQVVSSEPDRQYALLAHKL